MRVDELTLYAEPLLPLLPEGGADFAAPSLAHRVEVALRLSQHSGEALLCAGTDAVPVRGADRAAEGRLRQLLGEALPRLCWIAQRQPKAGPAAQLQVQVHRFPASLDWAEAVDLGVDDRLVEDVRRRRPELADGRAVLRWLEGELLLPGELGGPEGSCRALLSGGRTPDEAFRLHGRALTVHVARSGDRLRIERLVGSGAPRRPDEARPVHLLRAPLRLCDVTQAAAFRGAAKNELDLMVERAESYLALWRDYNRLEREAVLRRARELRWVAYDEVGEADEGRYRFRLRAPRRSEESEAEGAGPADPGDAASRDPAADFLAALRDLPTEATLAATDEIPRALLATAEAGEGAAAPPARRPRHFLGAVAASDAARRTLTLRARGDLAPPGRGFLSLDLGGDEKRLQRRDEALARVLSADCPLPQLGLLIEGRPAPVARRRPIEPLSPAAVQALGGRPTSAQVRALRIALNTPDLALIQGPPGTGKTSVLAALQVRLAEAGEGAALPGQTLLSSYQHDAVDHAVSRSRVFGLPAVKIGGRRGEIRGEDDLDRWRAERCEALSADLSQLPSHPAAAAYVALRDLAVRYRLSARSLGEAQEVLAEAEERAGRHLPGPLCDRLLALRQRLGAPLPPPPAALERQRAEQAVRGLRVSAAAFSDDGPRQAGRARQRLLRLSLLTPEEAALLEQAEAQAEGAAPKAELLAGLSALQGTLLDRLRRLEGPRDLGPPPVIAEVADLLGECTAALLAVVRGSSAGIADALELLLGDLGDRDASRAAVLAYTAVLAATCQQSASRAMEDAQEAPPRNVLVDEAARASPLDLLIPLVKAARRAVLFGDHRQLPHLLEPEIERQLETSLAEETKEALKKSLFERLFKSLKAREAEDGVPRVVTLDRQYRMHPVLGDFVSAQFYAPHGEAFESGTDAAALAHGLGDLGYRARGGAEAVAAWIDVPRRRGQERPRGPSFDRPAEAQRVAKEAQRLLLCRPDLSLGIISFYAAQVDELLRCLLREGLAERRPDGTLAVAEAYRRYRDGERLRERLRVGTVDAFQGMEFDVVILSMTRSNDQDPAREPAGAARERARRRQLGHLGLPNRLCVALSRQKRLLIVTGDAALAQSAEACAAAPALSAFYDLCGGDHGCRL